MLVLAPLAFLIVVVAVMVLTDKSFKHSLPSSAVGDDDVEARLFLLPPVPVLFLRFASFCDGGCASFFCPPVTVSPLLLLVVVVLLPLVPFCVAARRWKEATFLGWADEEKEGKQARRSGGVMMELEEEKAAIEERRACARMTLESIIVLAATGSKRKRRRRRIEKQSVRQ